MVAKKEIEPSFLNNLIQDNGDGQALTNNLKETKEKVRRAMIQLGYEPGLSNGTPSCQNSKTAGIILPPSSREAFENPFYLEVIRGISQFCNQRQ